MAALPKIQTQGQGRRFQVVDAQTAHDDHFKKFTPMPATYLNQARYDDDVPKPKRAIAPADDPEIEMETDPYVRSINRVALPWLWRRGGLPPERIDALRGVIQSLAVDAKELHQRGELTDKYTKVICDELNDFASRDPSPF